MSQTKVDMVVTRFAVLLFCLTTAWPSAVTSAQTSESVEEMKVRVAALMKETKFTEALPLLEKLVVAEPNEPQTHYYLGNALLGQAANSKDQQARKSLRIRARQAFIRSKELGIGQPNIDAMIQGLPADGSDGAAFSQNYEANALMDQAEGLFAQGKMDAALNNYQKALALDPKLYHAALFSGDVFMQKEDFAQAEIWYQKAIAIDPNKETAWRYSATPLMKQQKYDQARDRYIEAYISEPYNRFTAAGLTQWAQATRASLAHPQINIPTNVTFDEKGNANISLGADTLLGEGKEDGSFAWISYGASRSLWHKEKFARAFPNEQTYRHSLLEEAEALRGVISMATGDKATKKLSTTLAKLKKLNDEGLLEAYILLARPDQGIARDHPAYLKDNRDKLRRYVVTYVVTGGGN